MPHRIACLVLVFSAAANADETVTMTGATETAMHPIATSVLVLEAQRARMDCTRSRPTVFDCARVVEWTISNPSGEPARATFRWWGGPAGRAEAPVRLDGRAVPLRVVDNASLIDVEVGPGGRARLEWAVRSLIHYERWAPDGPIEHLHPLATGSPGRRLADLTYADGLSPNQRRQPAWQRRGLVVVELIVPAHWIPVPAPWPRGVGAGTGYSPRGPLELLPGDSSPAPVRVGRTRWGTARYVVRCAADAEVCGMRFAWGSAASTGGPMVGAGFGVVHGQADPAGFRARFGWELGLTRSAIAALSLDTDFATRLRPAATVSLAQLGLPIIASWRWAPPGVLLGGGLVVDALPSPRAGARMVMTVFGWGVGLEWSLDLFLGESITAESTLLLRFHL